MGRKQFGNRRPAYNATKDVGLYVISDDDTLMTNVNNVLKRRGIIGVKEPTGSVRYFVDGRNGITSTIDKLQSAVTNFGEGEEMPEDFGGMKMYDYAAHQVFLLYGIDMSLIGSNVIYEMVRRVVMSGFEMTETLKELCGEEQSEFMMSYSQMVRNIRYAFSHSRLSHLRSRAAVRLLAMAVYRRMEELGRS